ncbi:MAG: hypothetical protein RIT26_1061 [Pseudomonadota bacterium]|jgi:hypothetical protein
MSLFFQTLKTQRWDDHRFYHQSRINQSLHLVSALSFLTAYAYLFIDPAVSGWIAWLVAMTTRQLGHFVFEPDGYDEVNQVTNAHKEEIKVGYNLFRKVILLSICALIPVLAWFAPETIYWMVPESYENNSFDLIGMAWVMLGFGGMCFRVCQLWVRDGWVQGVAWASKIITDPIHDIILYHKAPLYLWRGELIDPMSHVRQH